MSFSNDSQSPRHQQDEKHSSPAERTDGEDQQQQHRGVLGSAAGLATGLVSKTTSLVTGAVTGAAHAAAAVVTTTGGAVANVASATGGAVVHAAAATAEAIGLKEPSEEQDSEAARDGVPTPQSTPLRSKGDEAPERKSEGPVFEAPEIVTDVKNKIADFIGGSNKSSALPNATPIGSDEIGANAERAQRQAGVDASVRSAAIRYEPSSGAAVRDAAKQLWAEENGARDAHRESQLEAAAASATPAAETASGADGEALTLEEFEKERQSRLASNDLSGEGRTEADATGLQKLKRLERPEDVLIQVPRSG